MIPRDSQTGRVVVSAIKPRRAAILCWLLDHAELWETLIDPQINSNTGGPIPRQLTNKGCGVVSAALKDAGFYAANNNSIEPDVRLYEARLVQRQDLRDRTLLRRLAASYKPPHAPLI